MRRILLVARREFLQITRTKSFWLTLLITPAMILLMPLFGRLIDPPETDLYILHDASGRYGAAIERRLELNEQRSVLYAFAGYARRWGLASPDPRAVWDDGQRPFSDDEVQAFVAAGGVDAALAEAGGVPRDAPAFTAPDPDWRRIPVPEGVPTAEGPEVFGQAIGRYLEGGADRPRGVRPAAAAIYIPAEIDGSAGPVRIWTSGGSFNFVDIVRRELGGVVRLAAAEQAGLDPETAARVQSASVPLSVSAPPRGGGRQRLALQSALPLGVAYFLLITVFVSGAWLLQGVIEERSNKLLEAILACVSPRELMYGKLIGIAAVGFTVIVTWGAFVAAGIFAMPSSPATDVIRPALVSLGSPWMAAALLFYFVTGYLICAMIYLAIGAVSESMTDAQAYLTPVSLALFLPFFLLGQLISNPEAMAAKVMSWIPVYTPFAMMARMGVGVEAYEVIGTSLLLVAFVVLELYLLGRVFQASLLRVGQPPRIAEFARLMFQKAAR